MLATPHGGFQEIDHAAAAEKMNSGMSSGATGGLKGFSIVNDKDMHLEMATYFYEKRLSR